METLELFIDANNYCKRLENIYNSKVKVDWQHFLLGIKNYISKIYPCYLENSYYCFGLPNPNDNYELYLKQKNFIDKLGKCRYITIITGTTMYDRNSPSLYREKQNDVNMTSYMLRSKADILGIMSADSDYIKAIDMLKSDGKKIVGILPSGTHSNIIASTIGKNNMFYLSRKYLDRYVTPKNSESQSSITDTKFLSDSVNNMS